MPAKPQREMPATVQPPVSCLPFLLTPCSFSHCSSEYAHWLFQWAFVSTAATIVSGSVAQRIRLEAYALFAVLLSVFTCKSPDF